MKCQLFEDCDRQALYIIEFGDNLIAVCDDHCNIEDLRYLIEVRRFWGADE